MPGVCTPRCFAVTDVDGSFALVWFAHMTACLPAVHTKEERLAKWESGSPNPAHPSTDRGEKKEPKRFQESQGEHEAGC